MVCFGILSKLRESLGRNSADLGGTFMLEKIIDKEIRNSLVSIDRLFLAEKLREMTVRHIEMSFEKQLLGLETSEDAIQKEKCLKEMLKIGMKELWVMRKALDDMRQRDRHNQQIYKMHKNGNKLELLIKLAN